MKWKAYHSISALSHFCRHDFPRPFSDCSYYEDIIRNLFSDKHSREVVEIETVYEIDVYSNGSYFEIKVYAPKVNMKMHEVINVEQFVAWYNERFNTELQKQDDTRYYYGDGYTRHAISIHEVSKGFDFILIQLKIGKYDL